MTAKDVPLFDLDAGRALRDAGAESTAAAATAGHKTWWPKAEGALRQLIASGREFTADDLNELVGERPDHPNQIGAIFLVSSQRGEIRAVNVNQSRARSRKAGKLNVWVAA